MGERLDRIMLWKYGGDIMKKRILSLLMTLCVAVCFVPTLAFADETPTQTVVKIDVGGENVETTEYKIDDTGIILRSRDSVLYELTGTTDKKISVWGSNNASDIDQAFYIKLNNVTVNGGIIVENSPVKMVIDVSKGTTNKINRVSANNLTIKGSGILNASYFDVTQKTSYMPSALHITDTTINVQCEKKRSCEFNGPCVLDGSANVTYVGGGIYAPLQVGVKNGDTTHSLTLKDNAKLYCLQDDMGTPASASVNGLEIFNAPLLLEGNSYLEAEGKDSISEYKGCGLISRNNITLKGNAAIKATGYDVGLSTAGNLEVNGGKIIAKSKDSNGIAAANVTIKNAEAEVEGYWPALYGSSAVSVENSKVTAEADDVAIYSPVKVTITNSIIKATSPDNYDGIRGNTGTKISGSWIETSGDETFADEPNPITNSVLFNGNNGKTIGNPQIPGDVTVGKDMTLDIAKDTSITVPNKKIFTNHGKIDVKGTFTKAEGGTVICDSHSGDTATCVKKATCDVCQAEYGDIDANNHEELKHVEAKAATKDQEGNLEYWYCEDCGKYFADKGGEKEIAQADTVIAKLPADPAADKNKDQNAGDKKNDAPTATGDDSNLALWAALLLLSGCAAGGTVLYRRKQN